MSRATTFIFRVQDEFARGQAVANGDRRYSMPAVGMNIGGAATVAGAFTQTVNNLRDSLNNFARQIEHVSPAISRERALGEVRQLKTDIYSDRRMGDSLAQLVRIESELSSEFQKLYADLMRGPAMAVNEILKILLEVVKFFREFWGKAEDWVAVKLAELYLMWLGASKEQTEQSINELKKTQERERRAREAENATTTGLDALFSPLPIPATDPMKF